MSRHVADWTLRRRFADKHVGRIAPGRHRTIWDLDLQVSALIRDEEAFNALARQLAAA